MLNLNFIRQRNSESYLSCINEIESSLLSNDAIKLNIIYSKSNRIKNIILRFIVKFIDFPYKKYIFVKNQSKINFSVLMGASFTELIPYFLYSSNNFIYMYDGWPRFHRMIAIYSKFLNVKTIFFSSYKATNSFNEINSGIKAIWVPEAIELKNYYNLEYNKKDIDVLEFGRKYDLYHNGIVGELSTGERVHVFEKNKGQLVFKSRNDFLNGLARSKISICVPSNITHPERAENISSMTLRYLQSMASKCLIVGIIPEEMNMLFDYNPIIDIDFEDPAKQILNILDNYDSYVPLIDKNYMEVQKSHTWAIRIKSMLKIIEDESGE